jgi:predicted HTH transcriptional regulator
VTLRRTKRKDGPVEDTLVLYLRPVLGSCVLEASHEGLRQTLETAPSVAAARDVVRDACETGPVTRPQLLTLLQEDGRQSRASAYRSLKALVDEGFLRDVGTDRRNLYVLATAGHES